MERVVIVSGARTPIGGYGGTLKDVPVYKLGAAVLNEAVKRADIDPARWMKWSWDNPIRTENPSIAARWRCWRPAGRWKSPA